MSDYLDSEELLKDFFSEANGQVEALEQNILVLESDPGNKDSIDEIFRAAHTLKGGAATVEMMELSSFTHHVEDVLDDIRSERSSVTPEVVDILLASIDVIKAMLQSRMEGAPYDGDISAITASLEALKVADPKSKKKDVGKTAAKATGAPSVAAPSAAKAAVQGSLKEEDIIELMDAAGGLPVYLLKLSFNPDDPMNTISGIHAFAQFREVGTVLRTVPEFEELYEDQFFPVVEYYIASDKPLEAIEKRGTISDVVLNLEATEIKPGQQAQASAAVQAKTVAPAPAALVSTAAAATPAPAAVAAKAAVVADDEHEEAHEEAGAAVVAKAAPAAQAKKAEAGGDQNSILRVDSRRIDNLLNLVSETVINKATFNQIAQGFSDRLIEFNHVKNRYQSSLRNLFEELPRYFTAVESGTPVKEIRKELLTKYNPLFENFDSFGTDLKNDIGKFRSTSQTLGRIAGELQEGVMRIRMVPVSQIFSRFPRLVRDLSKTLNKKINLVIEGEDTELDKSVVEDLLDPIMHSVRNALDHGVESPADRLAAGKPEEGTVILKASNEGNRIVIEIADDGKGIDVEAVKAKAIERGVLIAGKDLTDSEAFQLIFEPGFSTAKVITNISGRGVGLDVVKRSIEKLNGTISIDSKKGEGTRFTIRLPLTLAIIQGLLVRVGAQVYSIPIASVVESHRVKPSDIKRIDNHEVFNIRDEVITVLYMSSLFNIKNEMTNEHCFIVVVGAGDKRVGLIVDSLVGEEDVVIKPLRDQYVASQGIAGASILGDGSVCLIVDVAQLLELGSKQAIIARNYSESRAFAAI